VDDLAITERQFEMEKNIQETLQELELPSWMMQAYLDQDIDGICENVGDLYVNLYPCSVLFVRGPTTVLWVGCGCGSVYAPSLLCSQFFFFLK
jgi:hypothetical protein